MGDSGQAKCEVDTYYLWFGSTMERNRFNAGGGGFSSLEEAKSNAATDVGKD